MCGGVVVAVARLSHITTLHKMFKSGDDEMI
jgi:hypothetical protein